MEEREEQLVGEVRQHFFERIFAAAGARQKSDLIWFQVEAEGVARRKAEARAQEAEGRAQVEAPLLFALCLKFN